MANPNPSPATRFGAGKKANPQGKTSKHRKDEIKAAELAARLRVRMLKALDRKTKDVDEATLDAMTTEALRLFKDSEDRAGGLPMANIDAKVEHSSAVDKLRQLLEGKPGGATEGDAEG